MNRTGQPRQKPIRSRSSSVVPPEPPHVGDRMLISCEGGPGIARLVHYPPPLEIEEGHHGMYVLDERGDPDHPEYIYVYVDEKM